MGSWWILQGRLRREISRRPRPSQARVASWLLPAALGLVACSESVAPPSEKPARVENARAESALATVTLTERAEQRLGVETVEAAIRRVPQSRTLGGECMSPVGRTSVVQAPFAGIILGVTGREAVPVGASLQAGDAIFRLVPLLASEGDLHVDAEREVETARVRVEVAGARARRADELKARDAASDEQVELAHEELTVAQAALKAAEAQEARLGVARLDSAGGLVLSAPSASILQDLFVSAGQTVAAGSLLFRLEELDPIWVRVPAYVGDLAGFDLEAPAWVEPLSSQHRAGQGRREAKPVLAPRSANPRSASADLYYELPNPGMTLRAGERVKVTLRLKAEREALVVPWSSVIYDAHGGTWVYVRLAPGTYARQRIELTSVVGGDAILARGPEPGTPVVSTAAAEIFGTEFGIGK